MNLSERQKYEQAIKMYRNGDSSYVESILKMLSKKQFVKYDEDINFFLTVVQRLAKQNNDRNIIAYTKQVGTKISQRDGNDNGYTSTYENVISTENECILVLKKSLHNDEFEVAINNIIKYILTSKNFHTAYIVLKTIKEINYTSQVFEKRDVALLFIERMFKVIVERVKPHEEGIMFKKYVSEWTHFSSEDFINYQKLVSEYTDQFKISKILSMVNSNDPSKIEMEKNNKKLIEEERKYRDYCRKILPYERINKGASVKIYSIKYDGYNYIIKFSANNFTDEKKSEIYVRTLSGDGVLARYIMGKYEVKLHAPCDYHTVCFYTDHPYFHSSVRLRIKTNKVQNQYFVYITD